jgi:hypothetical protein
MLLEGVLLERLCCVPKARRQEWLRGLLVSGLLEQARQRRAVTASERGQGGAGTGDDARDAGPWGGFGRRPGRPSRPGRRPDGEAVKLESAGDSGWVPPPPPDVSPLERPFAHLRRVIG